MHGVKQEELKLEETNLAAYGGKEHHELKHEASLKEPAWKGCGAAPGIEIWRINKFKVEAWDKKEYGSFYSGDAYIVLDTYKARDKDGKEVDKLTHDIHFWLGKKAEQDKRGTAAYKTVELDDFFEGTATQFRQTQGHESKEFLAMFSGTIHVMEGGTESGFHHVKPEEYTPRLSEVIGLKTAQIKINEVPLDGKSLHSSSTFVLDSGLTIFQYNGADANMWEKTKAREFLLELVDKRNGLAAHVVVESDDDNGDFWKYFKGKVDVPAGTRPAVKPNPRHHTEWHPSANKSLTRVELKGTHAKYSSVAKSPAKLVRGSVDEKGVAVIDVEDEDKEHHVYVYVGKDCPKPQGRLGIVIGQEYLNQNKLNANTCVRRIHGGGNHKHVLFEKCFDG